MDIPNFSTFVDSTTNHFKAVPLIILRRSCYEIHRVKSKQFQPPQDSIDVTIAKGLRVKTVSKV